tara:strand:+ start:2232 stop:3392 length:1161 start_codon:yes stop_codon:yes gene_type:complete
MICVGLDFPFGTPLKNYINLIESVDADIFKLNPAFNPNLVVEVAQELRKRNLKWIYDGKVGDVPHTNQAYAYYIYDELGAWGCTLNPYVGFEALEPFFLYKDKHHFLLCKTTNKGQSALQSKVWRDVLVFARERKLSVVFPSNQPHELVKISDYLGEGSLILSPGIGAQGGSITCDLRNVIYSASRSVILSPSPRDALLNIRSGLSPKRVEPLSLFEGISEKGIVKKGKFVLSSGDHSDTYIDLRSLSAYPETFYEVCHKISELVKKENHILGVETASISVSSHVSFILNRPFGFVRKEKKDHGSRRLVEGIKPSTSRVTLIEDVVTTGASVLNALRKAQEEGYKVDQVICIIDRTNLLKEILSQEGIEYEILIKVPPVSSRKKKG